MCGGGVVGGSTGPRQHRSYIGSNTLVVPVDHSNSFSTETFLTG